MIINFEISNLTNILKKIYKKIIQRKFAKDYLRKTGDEIGNFDMKIQTKTVEITHTSYAIVFKGGLSH